MRSIRQSLATWLVGYLAVLWAVCGYGVFYALKGSLEADIDRNLDSLVDKMQLETSKNGKEVKVRFSSPGLTPPLRDGTVPLFGVGSSYFFQIWESGSGKTVLSSQSLGGVDLPIQRAEPDERSFCYDRLDGVGTIRALAVSGTKVEGLGFDVDFVVASDRKLAARRLTTIATILLLACACGALLTWFIVATVVGKGLRPLDELGFRLSALDPQHFEMEKLPRELQPISMAIRELVDRMRQGFERERRFSSDLAHEFRTPISELRAISEVATRWPHRASPKDYADMHSISVRMETILSSLLTLARVEAGSAEADFSRVAFQKTVLRYWSHLADNAAEKSLTLVCDIESNLVVETNEGLFERILMNLLENAVEYSPAGEEILVSTEKREDGTVYFEISNLAPNLRHADIEHLFERFWRADDSRTDSVHSGLGLSLCRSCAEAMGYHIHAVLNDVRVLKFVTGPFAVSASQSPAEG